MYVSPNFSRVLAAAMILGERYGYDRVEVFADQCLPVYCVIFV